MGFDDDKANELARSCGRSVTILSRLISSGAAAPPEWIGRGAALLPALLAGGWSTAFPQDKEIVSGLAGGRRYSEFEADLLPFARLQDPPIDRAGEVWKIRAPVDAFVHLGHLIGTDDLDRLRQAATQVFSRIEERPSPDDLFQLEPQTPEGYSAWLREGLATTLLQIATLHAPAALIIPGSTPQVYVNDLVRALPRLSENYRLLASLKNELALLAEAAPDPLLSALERLLEGDLEKIRPIFSESEHLLAPLSAHTGVLWALECLAWDPTLLRRVAYILARLAAIDPGGRLVNRPITSLRQIFLSWMPTTNANVKQRLAVLDYLIVHAPVVAWDLLVKLFPKGHDTSTPSQKPRFREAGASERTPLTYGEVWESQRGIVSRALDMAAGDPERLATIVKAVANFEEEQRARALEMIDAYLKRAFEADHRRVWSALRDLANRHRAFSDADWSLPPSELERLGELIRRHEPTNPIDPISYLFDDWSPDIPNKLDNPLAIDAARRAAVEGLLTNGGVDSVLLLVERVKLPQFVASALVEMITDSDRYELLIARTVGRNEKLGHFATVISGAAARKFGVTWAHRLRGLADREGWSPNTIAALLLNWPDNRNTWLTAESFGMSTEEAYWTQKYPFMPNGDVSDLIFAAQKYMSFGRASAAIEALHMRIGELPVSLMFKLLDALIPELNRGKTVVHTMLIYHLENIFESLRKRDDAGDDDMARREYAYLPLLEHRNKPLILHRIMAQSPELYVSVVCDVFKSASGEQEEEITDEKRTRASAGYRLLGSFNTVPGEEDGAVNLAPLRTWIQAVRTKSAELDRARIADEYVGHLLAHAPPDKHDGFWPDRSIRIVLEELDSDDVENGLSIERFNMRGVHTKAMFEGGVQERELADRYRKWAKATADWPRTSAMLERIAQGYDRDAEREDVEAQQNKMRF
jgi:hypothetical protein